jgi:hypothetical protein
MEIKIVDEKGQEKKVEETLEAPQGDKMDVVNPYSLDEIAIHQVLEVDGDADKSKYRNEIKTLHEWAKTQTKDMSPENLKWTVRELQLKLGTPPFGEDRVKFLSNFAYLDMEGKRIEKEKKKYM